MGKVTLQDTSYHTKPRETVLDALIRQGAGVRFSCKKGVCKTCKLEVVEGNVPRAATRAFEHLDESYFLPCLSVIDHDINIKFPVDYEFPEGAGESSFELTEELNEDKPAPDPALFVRVQQDELLIKILTSFYDEVYTDERLSPFFKSITKDYAIQKQFNFLYMLFSGEEVYMGARPRNAHHWMVISDELFDYREQMMEKHMRKMGLEEHFILKWKEMQEFYRSRMVKSRPWKKIWQGHHYPLEGLEEITAEVAMICDHCESEINLGQRLKFHVHTGKVYCRDCASGATGHAVEHPAGIHTEDSH